eukprot:TRINITY_DN80686_c0_g1_i1.p1 TRINITY_DN80686_c0_g1~~TRINITY_DN80686_c0_g1_i1.p1  ORF type:complete len:239 (-),score=31.91 TRINITY_DN80686_c0_g1_i1:223-939(-)
MYLTVTEMSGRTHDIDDLFPSSLLSELLGRVKASLAGAESNRLGLIHGNELLTSRQNDKQLSELGIVDDSILTVLKVSGVEFLDFDGKVGDEDLPPQGQSDVVTTVRICLLDSNTCILVRRTDVRTWIHSRGLFQSRLTWDICRGTYTVQENKDITCSWHHKFRRSRGGISQSDHAMQRFDSGWLPRDACPKAWQQIEHAGDAWRKDADLLIDGDCILGIKLSGRGSVEEALRILALA